MIRRRGRAGAWAIVASAALLAAPGAGTAGDIGIAYISHGFEPYYYDFGSGYFSFRRSGFDSYGEWWNAWANCGRTGNFGPCDELSEQYDFSIPIEQAFLSADLHEPRPYPGSMHGWEIDVMAWNLQAGRPVCDAGHCVGWTRTYIELADEPGGLYLNWSCRGRTSVASRFAFLVAWWACADSMDGSALVDGDTWHAGDDGYRFFWRAVEMPEPGTLALLCLGLFGMGASRRRRSARPGVPGPD